MRTILTNVFIGPSLYEVFWSGTKIRRVIFYSGSNNGGKDLQWTDIPDDAKAIIIEKVWEELEA